MKAFCVLLVALVSGCVLPDNLMQETIAFSEAQGTLWIRSCDRADELKEVELLRSDQTIWDYTLVGEPGVSLDDVADVRSVLDSTAYSSTDTSKMAWLPGDVLRVRTTGGSDFAWQLGKSPTITLDDLRDRGCPSGVSG